MCIILAIRAGVDWVWDQVYKEEWLAKVIFSLVLQWRQAKNNA